jgi:hypothetical protein
MFYKKFKEKLDNVSLIFVKSTSKFAELFATVFTLPNSNNLGAFPSLGFLDPDPDPLVSGTDPDPSLFS